MTKTKTYQVDLELGVEAQKFMKDSRDAYVSFLQILADKAACGGMMLDPAIAKQIRTLIPNQEDQQEIVRQLEAGLNKKNGSVTAEWTPDPSYVPMLNELATTRGVTIKYIVQEMMDYAIGMGWLYSMPPGVTTCFFTEQESISIRKAIGNKGDHKFSGADILKLLASAAVAA